MLEARFTPLSLRFCMFSQSGRAGLAAASCCTVPLLLAAKTTLVLWVLQGRWNKSQSFRQCTASPGMLDIHYVFFLEKGVTGQVPELCGFRGETPVGEVKLFLVSVSSWLFFWFCTCLWFWNFLTKFRSCYTSILVHTLLLISVSVGDKGWDFPFWYFAEVTPEWIV